MCRLMVSGCTTTRPCTSSQAVAVHPGMQVQPEYAQHHLYICHSNTMAEKHVNRGGLPPYLPATLLLHAKASCVTTPAKPGCWLCCRWLLLPPLFRQDSDCLGALAACAKDHGRQYSAVVSLSYVIVNQAVLKTIWTLLHGSLSGGDGEEVFGCYRALWSSLPPVRRMT